MIKNRRLKRIGAVAGTLSAALLLPLTQANAAGGEVDRATTTRHDGEWVKCASKMENGDNVYLACFDPEGDWFNVYDGKADGSAAVVDWQVGKRYGAIFNADGMAAQRYKQKNFPEGATVRFRICLGHWDTKMITAGTCSGWVSNPT
uniref:Secreted protein n=1 Tax=Streptomyces sp. NBC_00003 TaxID=2903608 RepID=A0AAU2V4E0_9ACTN